MTEDEAKAKWCPFARTTMYVRGDAPPESDPVHLIGQGANRLVVDDAELQAKVVACIETTGATRCIGSACMAWTGTGCGLIVIGQPAPMLGFHD